MRILVDTREQWPFTFEGMSPDGVETVRAPLETGDYSIPAHTHLIAVERKTLPDLVHCLGADRERFEREMLRSRALDSFAVVVEARWEDLAQGRYRSKLNPVAACQSILAFAGRYRIPFLFAGTRREAELVTYGLLRQYLKARQDELRRSLKAQAPEAPKATQKSGSVAKARGKGDANLPGMEDVGAAIAGS